MSAENNEFDSSKFAQQYLKSRQENQRAKICAEELFAAYKLQWGSLQHATYQWIETQDDPTFAAFINSLYEVTENFLGDRFGKSLVALNQFDPNSIGEEHSRSNPDLLFHFLALQWLVSVFSNLKDGHVPVDVIRKKKREWAGASEEFQTRLAGSLFTCRATIERGEIPRCSKCEVPIHRSSFDLCPECRKTVLEEKKTSGLVQAFSDASAPCVDTSNPSNIVDSQKSKDESSQKNTTRSSTSKKIYYYALKHPDPEKRVFAEAINDRPKGVKKEQAVQRCYAKMFPERLNIGDYLADVKNIVKALDQYEWRERAKRKKD